jgi:hypothetical protein
MSKIAEKAGFDSANWGKYDGDEALILFGQLIVEECAKELELHWISEPQKTYAMRSAKLLRNIFNKDEI